MVEDRVLFSIAHTGKEQATILNIEYASNDKKGTLRITPAHYIFLRSQNKEEEISHVMAKVATVGDFLIIAG